PLMRRWSIFTWLQLVALYLSLAASACQHREPYQGSPALNPCISIVETPPQPLPSDLVVKQAIPLPVQSDTAVARSTVKEPVVQTSPPPIQLAPAQQSLTLPVSYTPKRSGLSAALDHYLDHRNDEAVAALKHYPTDDQDIALVALPLLARIDQGENWLSLNGPQKLAILESLRNLTRRLSKSSPLVLQHAALVDDLPTRFGELKLRKTTNYYAEDMVFAYAELVNLLDFANAEGLYNIRLDVSLELTGPDGKVYFSDSKPFQRGGSIGPRSDFHVAAYFNLPRQVVPGNYQLQLHVLDRDTNRSAKQTLLLQVVEGKKTRKGT
ncbi:MAG TPA: hypothetical protein PLX97_02240, partial [Gemmatales bacterium]|nr:hypothetical protein [Gemmatales bacterium]